jgi:hypothetical protein
VVVHLAHHTYRSGLKETLPNLDKTTAMMVERENASTREWVSPVVEFAPRSRRTQVARDAR